MKKALKTKGFLYIRDISIKKRVVKKLPIALERIMKAVGSIEIKGANF